MFIVDNRNSLRPITNNSIGVEVKKQTSKALELHFIPAVSFFYCVKVLTEKPSSSRKHLRFPANVFGHLFTNLLDLKLEIMYLKLWRGTVLLVKVNSILFTLITF